MSFEEAVTVFQDPMAAPKRQTEWRHIGKWGETAKRPDESDKRAFTNDALAAIQLLCVGHGGRGVTEDPAKATIGGTRRNRMEPIFQAVLKGEKEVLRLLRDDPAVARTRISRDHLVEAIPHWLYIGDTSLHLAAAGLWSGVARALLQSGADPNARNRRGATPLHYACDPRPRSGGTWNPTTQASLIKMLVEHGAEIDRGDRGGATALHRAVRARSVAAVRQLLALGAHADCALKKRCSSPLHLAAQPTGAGGTAGVLGDQLEIIDLLLQHGADPAAADAAGRTPVDWARNERVLKALQSRHPNALS